MKHLTGTLKYPLATILVTVALPCLTQASTILVDDNANIYSFPVGVVSPPPTPVAPYQVFSGTPSPVMGMAVTYQDNPTPTSPYEVLVASGNSIYAYSSVGAQSVFASVGGVGLSAVGLAIDGTGNVYTAVNNGGTINTVDEFGKTGSGPTAIAITQTSQVDALLADNSGDLYVADDDTGNITEYLASSGYTTTVPIATDLPGIDLYGMAFANGNLFVSYQNISGPGGGIFEISGGQYSTFYSTNCTPPTSPSCIYPTGLGFDYSGDLYLLYTNSANGTVGGVDVFDGQVSGTPSNSPTSFATGLVAPAGIVQLTPEPGTILLLAGGLMSLGMLQRRRRKSADRN